jgi:hypothetical protein
VGALLDAFLRFHLFLCFDCNNTMKIFALSALLVSASAFAPAVQQRSSTALNYDINAQFGVTPETGNKCPPLGAMLLQDTDERALKWFQNAEIKNGRVSRIGVVH